MDNPEKLATQGYTRYRTKRNKTNNTPQKTKMVSNSKMLDINIRKHTQKNTIRYKLGMF